MSAQQQGPCRRLPVAVAATTAHRALRCRHLFATSRRRSITLVCRQWRRLFYEQRELWRSLTIAVPLRFRAVDVQACECKLALVRRVAPMVADFRIGCVSHGREATFPEAGPDLPRFLEALQSATGLTSLHLTSHSDRGEPAGEVAKALAGLLPRLQALAVHTANPDTFLQAVLLIPPRLTSL